MQSWCVECGASTEVCKTGRPSRFCDACKKENARLGRRKALCSKYGISLDIYEKILEEQGFACAICGSPASTKCLAIDHCHETGGVRGLLCTKCNGGLGQFNDNVTTLEAAIKYLESYGFAVAKLSGLAMPHTASSVDAVDTPGGIGFVRTIQDLIDYNESLWEENRTLLSRICGLERELSATRRAILDQQHSHSKVA